MIERSGGDQEAGMLGGFVMAAEAGIVERVLELPADAKDLSLPVRDPRAIAAILSGGQDAKAAKVCMLLARLAGLAAGDAGRAPQGAQAIQRPPAGRLWLRGIGLAWMHVGMGVHPHLVHGATLVWGSGERPAEKLLLTGHRRVALGAPLSGDAPNPADIAVSTQIA
jgi:hypothetical protein